MSNFSSYNLEIVRDHSLYGVKNILTDKLIIPIQYNKIEKFIYNNLIRVELDNKRGQVNLDGEIIIPLMYDFISTFRNNLANAKFNGKYGVINIENKKIINFIYQDIIIGDNYILAKFKNKYGFLSLSGKPITYFIYDSVDYFENDVAIVILNYKAGLINKNFEEITDLKYDYLDSHTQTPYIYARIGHNWGLLDNTGKEITSVKYPFSQIDLVIKQYERKLKIKQIYGVV